MKLQDLIPNQEGQEITTTKVIDDLKQHRYIDQPDVDAAWKAIDPNKHDIMNPLIRKDKWVKVDAENNTSNTVDVTSGGENNGGDTRREKVARIAVAIQKLIIKRAVSFCFGNAPEYNASPGDESEQSVMYAFKRILADVKCNALNRKLSKALFGFKEVAEYWYTVEKPNAKYGFDSAAKVRCAIFSPKFGDTLYPYFDATGDMVAFSRSYSRKVGNESVNYFETWTDEEHWLWSDGENGMTVVEGYPKPVAIGKIPIVFGHQPEFETEDVNNLVDRLETLLSNFADTNDYHASPKIFVTGQINGWSKKGESGAVIEGEDGATMQYVSWQNAPESVKLEIETLLKLIYTITQTPDISWDAVKGLNVSGVALKLLFMDAHLKVQDKCEIFDDYLARRSNIILALIGLMNGQLAKACDTIEIEPEIVPYIITSDLDDANYWMTVNGNKPLISQEESVAMAGISKDPEGTMEKLNAASTAEMSALFNEPVLDA